MLSATRAVAMATLAIAGLTNAPGFGPVSELGIRPAFAQQIANRADAPRADLAASTASAPGVATPDAPVATPASLLTETGAALRRALAERPEPASDEDKNELAAVLAHYAARAFEPLWATPKGLTPKAQSALAEMNRADDWGLDHRDFAVTAEVPAGAGDLTPAAVARAESEVAFALLKYGRYARGGRIINPTEQLSSYLDRRPQLLKPAALLEGLAAADDVAAYLRGLHPQHPQFEKLRQKFLDLRASKPGSKKALEARKVLANMEQWRWMPADLGAAYIWNNTPEFMQRFVVDGKVVRFERIVTGETGKQTPVFTRPLRRLTFKPTWIVPDSIKVNELWPSLLKGGRLMQEWALVVTTKDGKPLDWRKMDWTKTDIREFDVIQPNGPKSVMGKFKFSFPNQHTVFMHDTLPRDKYMFNTAQRTYSHGCIRVRNPMELAELILQVEKGWDAQKAREEYDAAPNNHTIELDRRVMVHMTYFTAMVDDDGALRTFRDVYGHEKRIALALEGKWSQIRKGRDHLAPVELDLSKADKLKGDTAEQNGGDFFSALFGLN